MSADPFPIHPMDGLGSQEYGPTKRAFASLDAEKQSALESDILDLLNTSNRGGSNTLIIPGEYLEVVITKR